MGPVGKGRGRVRGWGSIFYGLWFWGTYTVQTCYLYPQARHSGSGPLNDSRRLKRTCAIHFYYGLILLWSDSYFFVCPFALYDYFVLAVSFSFLFHQILVIKFASFWFLQTVLKNRLVPRLHEWDIYFLAQFGGISRPSVWPLKSNPLPLTAQWKKYWYYIFFLFSGESVWMWAWMGVRVCEPYLNFFICFIESRLNLAGNGDFVLCIKIQP